MARAVYKGLLLIADGLGDRPVASMGNKTPLEYASTPTLDRLAREGECGLMDPIAPGVRAGSDTAHLAILGYDPYKVYQGRGPFEALGIGMEVRGGDVALRCNFSTVDDTLRVLDRRAGRITEGTAELADAVNGVEIEGVQCFFKESVAHRGALVLCGEGLSPHITDADPHADGEIVHQAQPLDPHDAAAARTARIVNAFVRLSYERLKDHPVNRERIARGLPPANIILPRGAGVAPHLEPFPQKHGMTAVAVVETGLIRGIARFVGMDILDAPGATGGVDTDYASIADTLVRALRQYDFVLCNVKAPDLCGHDRNPQLKAQVIEQIDGLIARLLEQYTEPFYLLFTGDHSTPCSVGDHSGDPVPVLLHGPDLRGDEVLRFHEYACAKGALGRLRGGDLVPILTQLMGVQEKFGA
ncbi:MAG: 2,3-bisphosphoglycerate-independent phosphoglycerate mutase [Fimbriimonadales bacterium]|nr:2,3-bisphosphoglycerate-independent phosphoglycerate mutase [Fimbriimonadales bacterium]